MCWEAEFNVAGNQEKRLERILLEESGAVTTRDEGGAPGADVPAPGAPTASELRAVTPATSPSSKSLLCSGEHERAPA